MKLQRNALSVLEPPTGLEEDGDLEFDNSSCGSDAGEKDDIFCKFIQRIRFLHFVHWNLFRS